MLAALYRKHLTDCRQERLFLGNVGFLVSFVTVRGITHSIRAGRGPFRNVTPGGRHIHHMTFGIIGLLATGYAWNAQLGIGTNPAAILTGKILEDEKVEGTAHLAFGTNTGIGGENEASVHIDGLIKLPTIELDGRVVMHEGRLVG